MTESQKQPLVFPHRHLLGIETLSPSDIETLLDLSDASVAVSRQVEKKKNTLRGRTQINLFFESSTRTQSSFELAGKTAWCRRYEYVCWLIVGKKRRNTR